MAIKPTQEIAQEEKVYNNLELMNFENEFIKFKLADKEGKLYLTVGGEFAYLQSIGIVQAREKIKPEMKTLSDLPDHRILFKKLKNYTEYLNKRKQYNAWKFKKTHAIKKELEGWDNIAKTMPEVSKDEITTEDIDKTFFNL